MYSKILVTEGSCKLKDSTLLFSWSRLRQIGQRPYSSGNNSEAFKICLLPEIISTQKGERSRSSVMN